MDAEPGFTAVVHISLKNNDGSIIDSTLGQNPLQLRIGKSQINIPELEQAIIGMKPGDSTTLKLPIEKTNAFLNAEIRPLINGQELIFDIQLVDIVPLNQRGAEEQYKTGMEMQKLGRIDEAVSSFKRAILLSPEFPAPYFSLGALLQQRGYIDEAITLYQQVLQLCPEHSDTCNVLGSAFQAKGQLAEAIAWYQKAIQFNPNSFMAHNNLGSALKLQGDIDGAIKQYQRALKLNPNFAESLNNLGNALRDKNELDKAMSFYRRSIALKPDFADAHWNLSYALLLSGQFEEGWKEYEWRWKLKEPLHKLPQPLWDGSDCAGKTILLFAEQGFGDTIQFIRYITMVADKGIKVVLGCQKELKSLSENIQGVSQVIAYGEPLPQFDFQLPLISLPMVFKTTSDTIPSQCPYIQVGPRLIERWGKKMDLDQSKINIGLAWAGSPGHLNDRNRSCPLDMFTRLTETENCTFFSLQKILNIESERNMIDTLKLIDYTGEISDFADTAAIIMNLDLVISVDTAVAHLAGALGKKVWTLLPFAPDWRWMLKRDDSPWYPTMRLFRQYSWGDWRSVLVHVSQELTDQCKSFMSR
ncbi:MAG: tetratricopeptide repeat protein [Thermodesulfovibrionales bacterium]|nr:tetratricopeptide repeat protein [Thermodesulfovibrionales bacterium]